MKWYVFFLSCVICCLGFVDCTAANVGEASTARQFTRQKARRIHPDTLLTITCQQEFDQLFTSLYESISKGKKGIEIRIGAGCYTFRNNHLNLDGIKQPDVSIRIIGNKSIIVPQGRIIKASKPVKTPLDYRNSYLTRKGYDLNVWTTFHTTDSLIRVINKKELLCCLHTPDIFLSELKDLSKKSYIQYTEWYYTRICKIDSICGNNVYFKVPELFYIKDGYNVNYDYRWHKRMPRYRFFDPLSTTFTLNEHEEVIEGETGTFCLINDSELNSFTVEGVEVRGNHASKHLFNIKSTSFKNYFLLYGCIFKGQRGGVANFSRCRNIYIQHCEFLDQYGMVIDSDMYSNHTEICYNSFQNCGLGMMNSFCVRCRGDNYLISYNDFCNFGYGAIGVGIGYKFENPQISRGVVEFNIIYNTEDYVKKIDQRGLIDGGAIYLWTINDKAIIRYNFINNIIGAGSNRGIYCDDGAKNFVLYGNIIMNVKNSRAVDARYDAALEEFDSLQVSNINKEIYYNITDGTVKFQGKPIKDNGCKAGCNFFIKRTGNSIESDYKDVVFVDNDYDMSSCNVKQNKIVLDKQTKRLLSKTKVYKNIKKYIN